MKAVPSEKESILYGQRERKDMEEHNAYLTPAPVADDPSTRKSQPSCLYDKGRD